MNAGSGLLGAWVLVASMTLVGCDSSIAEDCEEMCERGQGCPPPTLVTYSCEAQCARIEDLAEASGCEDETEDYLSCAVDAPDACQPGVHCAAEGMAFFACADPYCDANPNAEECRGFTCGYTGGGVAQTCTVSARCTGGPEHELNCVEGVCTCKRDGADVGSVAFQEAFCSDDLDTAVIAAQAACGWTF